MFPRSATRSRRPPALTALALLALLLGSGAVARASDGRLLLDAAEFDPLQGEPPLPDGWAWTAADSAPARDYFILQLRSRILPQDHRDVARLGADELGYLPHDALLIRVATGALPRLRRWARTRALVPFQPAYRVDRDLRERARRDPDALLDVAILQFPGADAVDVSLGLRELGVELLEWDAASRSRLLARVPARRLAQVARIRDVQWIQPLPTVEQRNGTTAWVIQSDVSASTPVWAQGLLGDGQILGHIDGPIDLASCYFQDAANNTPGPGHRKIVAHHGSYTFPNGHGTHTAGTCAGDQEPISGVITDNGMGYHARIAHTNLSLINATNLRSKLDELYADGARIFTNSWGDDTTTKYNAYCVDIDALSWEQQDVLILFAVSDSVKVANPENAKNLIAVGGADQAPNEGNHCKNGDGPTSDGRRRPEITAPGCNINSASSGMSCAVRKLSGTSMACPAVAGAATLVRQYFSDGWFPTGAPVATDAFVPSGALIKATLLDAAVDMTGVAGYPSDTEGWGRLLLDDALFFAGDARKLWAVDVATANGLASAGDQDDYYFEVLSSALPLEVCLCFHDAPAALNASYAPVNDLDLELVDPNGVTFLGNVFSGGASTPGGSADPLNNVERVRIAAPVAGLYTLRVRATNVATIEAQSYAAVATGDLDPPRSGGFVSYGLGLAGSGGFVPTLTGSGTPDIGQSIAIDVGQGLGGASALLLLGFSRASLSFAGGELLVTPPWLVFPIQLGGSAGVAGAGSASLPGDLPNDPALVGFLVDLQCAIGDPAAPRNFALTAGLEMTIGG